MRGFFVSLCELPSPRPVPPLHHESCPTRHPTSFLATPGVGRVGTPCGCFVLPGLASLGTAVQLRLRTVLPSRPSRDNVLSGVSGNVWQRQRLSDCRLRRRGADFWLPGGDRRPNRRARSAARRGVGAVPHPFGIARARPVEWDGVSATAFGLGQRQHLDQRFGPAATTG